MFKNKKYEEYDFIASLGAACAASAVLRLRNLQDYSYPFDWLGGSTLKNRVKIVANSFDGWLKMEDLEFYGQRTSPVPCDIYKNIKTGIIYNHDFCINTPLKYTYNEVFEQYNRRTTRMMNNINKAKTICFFYLEPIDKKEPYNQEYLQECYDILSNYFKDKKITLKYIYNTNQYSYKKNNEIEIISTNYCTKNPETNEYEADIHIVGDLIKYVKLRRKFTLKRLLEFFVSHRVAKRADWERHNVKFLCFKFQFTKKNIKKNNMDGVNV